MSFYAWSGLTLLFFAVSFLLFPAERKRQEKVVFPLLILCVVALFFDGAISPIGVVVIAVGLSLSFASRVNFLTRGNWFLAALGVFVFLLAIHKLPGFTNPILASDVQIGAGNPLYTLRANFDKGLVAFLLLFAWPLAKADKALTWKPFAAALGFSLVVIAVAWSIWFIRFDVSEKLLLPQFAIIGLVLVVLPEQVFFQGLLGRSLALTKFPFLALIVPPIFYALAHGAFGTYTALVLLAGIGEAYLYFKTKSLLPSVCMHWAVNIVHFVFFTYPHG